MLQRPYLLKSKENCKKKKAFFITLIKIRSQKKVEIDLLVENIHMIKKGDIPQDQDQGREINISEGDHVHQITIEEGIKVTNTKDTIESIDIEIEIDQEIEIINTKILTVEKNMIKIDTF